MGTVGIVPLAGLAVGAQAQWASADTSWNRMEFKPPELASQEFFVSTGISQVHEPHCNIPQSFLTVLNSPINTAVKFAVDDYPPFTLYWRLIKLVCQYGTPDPLG
jgi:hypothetical protein